MPFESKAQQRFLFAKHPDIAKRWAAETPNIKALPARKSGSRVEALKRRRHPRAAPPS